MPLLLNENAPIDAAIFLLEAALVAGLMLGGFLLYATRKHPPAGPRAPQPPGSRVPWLVVWPGLAAVAYLLYLLMRFTTANQP